MNIFEYFKKKNIDTVDASFYRKIAEWDSWYRSNVRKFHFYRVYGGPGRDAAGIAWGWLRRYVRIWLTYC